MKKLKTNLIYKIWSFMSFLFVNFILLIKSSETPINVLPDLFDSSQKETMGLEYAPGIKTVKVFSASDNTNHYNNGVVMTSFKNNLYCMCKHLQQMKIPTIQW